MTLSRTRTTPKREGPASEAAHDLPEELDLPRRVLEVPPAATEVAVLVEELDLER
ncbi:MAG TPA: hypothetical protein VGG06_17360 [Thermoanaerobaculia bacterium]